MNGAYTGVKQNLFALGQLGTGFSLVAGPMEVLVGADRRQEAEELLSDAGLDAESQGTGEELEEAEEPDDAG